MNEGTRTFRLKVADQNLWKMMSDKWGMRDGRGEDSEAENECRSVVTEKVGERCGLKIT